MASFLEIRAYCQVWRGVATTLQAAALLIEGLFSTTDDSVSAHFYSQDHPHNNAYNIAFSANFQGYDNCFASRL
jgi:hypothetical protein